MDVDLVAPHYLPVTGGIEAHVVALAHYLVAEGHDVTIHVRNKAPGGDRLPAVDDDGAVSIRRYPVQPDLGYYASVFRPRLRGDVVHVHGFGMWTHDRIARRHGNVLMSLHHGIRFPTGPVGSVVHGLHRATIGRGTLRRCRAIIANTQLDVDQAIAAGADPERVHCIPVGVQDHAFTKVSPHGGDYILFLGRLHNEKGPLDAVRALTHLPDVDLLMAGPDQGEAANCMAEARRLGVDSRVRILGRVSDENKRSLIAGARCLVLPSHHEGLGIVVLEAWAQRTPTVAYGVGAIPYLVVDGEDGFVVPSGAVPDLASRCQQLADPKLRSAMGNSGYDKAWAMRESCMLKHMESLY